MVISAHPTCHTIECHFLNYPIFIIQIARTMGLFRYITTLPPPICWEWFRHTDGLDRISEWLWGKTVVHEWRDLHQSEILFWKLSFFILSPNAPLALDDWGYLRKFVLGKRKSDNIAPSHPTWNINVFTSKKMIENTWYLFFWYN